MCNNSKYQRGKYNFFCDRESLWPLVAVLGGSVMILFQRPCLWFWAYTYMHALQPLCVQFVRRIQVLSIHLCTYCNLYARCRWSRGGESKPAEYWPDGVSMRDPPKPLSVELGDKYSETEERSKEERNKKWGAANLSKTPKHTLPSFWGLKFLKLVNKEVRKKRKMRSGGQQSSPNPKTPEGVLSQVLPRGQSTAPAFGDKKPRIGVECEWRQGNEGARGSGGGSACGRAQWFGRYWKSFYCGQFHFYYFLFSICFRSVLWVKCEE